MARYKIVKVMSLRVNEPLSVFAGAKHIGDAGPAAGVFKDFYLTMADDQEHLMALYLSTAGQAIAIMNIHTGTLNLSLVGAREVFRPALLLPANAVVVCHNHPSGNVEPSDLDVKLTNKLFAAGENIGIRLLDHIIIGIQEEATGPYGSGFLHYSFASHGRMPGRHA